MNTANAMLVQMVTKVFERVSLERTAANVVASTANTDATTAPGKEIDIDQLKVLSKDAPAWLDDSAKDAYMLLQVLCHHFDHISNICPPVKLSITTNVKHITGHLLVAQLGSFAVARQRDRNQQTVRSRAPSLHSRPLSGHFLRRKLH
jgi:hypothetical protein